MASIYIKDIGPLKEIDITLNKVNVFIGPQSIGKSTIAKIMSFCNWFEKDRILNQSIGSCDWDYIEEKLIKYHNLTGFFSENSIIKYVGKSLDLNIEGKTVNVKRKEDFFKLELTKNAYIPSERNVLALPGILSIKLPHNYLLEFIDDWQDIRNKYTRQNSLKILNLGSEYYYNESENKDMVHIENEASINFSQSSSGLQSVIPLCVCVDYLTNWVYEHEENRSAEDRKLFREAIDKIILHYFNETLGDNWSEKLNEFHGKSPEELKKNFDIIISHLKQNTIADLDGSYLLYRQMLKGAIQSYDLQNKIDHPFATNLVIEEPEQNLFPETQVQLMYYILSKIEHRKNRDSLVLTTHSPYILYALNNCLLASIATETDEEAVNEVSSVPEEARISPQLVSVWEIKDGIIVDNATIQDEKGLIRGNYFERIMHNIMADFTTLLSLI